MKDEFLSETGAPPIQWRDHFSNGGVGITKFPAHRLPLYERAIKEHGDSRYFLKGCELHCSDTSCDTGPFYFVLERLEKEGE